MGTGHQVGEPLPLRTTLGRGTDGSRSANDSGQAAYMGVIQWRGFSFLATSAAKLGKTADTRGYRFLNKYFRNSRRRVGEGINDYITRKTETYWRACQALKRVMPRTRPTPTGPASWTETPYGAGSAWNSRRSSWASTTSNPDGEARLRPRTTLTATRPRPHGHGLLPRGQHGTGVIEFLEQLPELLLWELEVGLWKPSCPDGEGGGHRARVRPGLVPPGRCRVDQLRAELDTHRCRRRVHAGKSVPRVEDTARRDRPSPARSRAAMPTSGRSSNKSRRTSTSRRPSTTT